MYYLRELSVDLRIEGIGSLSSAILLVPIIDILPERVEFLPDLIRLLGVILVRHYRINIRYGINRL